MGEEVGKGEVKVTMRKRKRTPRPLGHLGVVVWGGCERKNGGSLGRRFGNGESKPQALELQRWKSSSGSGLTKARS